MVQHIDATIKQNNTDATSAPITMADVMSEEDIDTTSESHIAAATHIPQLYDEIMYTINLLSTSHLDTLISGMKQLMSLLSTISPSQRPTHIIAMRSLAPLLHQILLTCERHILITLHTHRSTLKLLHIHLSLFNSLLVKGFCRRPDETEEGEQQQTQDGVEGTGMGEGEGAKDVSDEIEDEEQLLGNKNDEVSCVCFVEHDAMCR